MQGIDTISSITVLDPLTELVLLFARCTGMVHVGRPEVGFPVSLWLRKSTVIRGSARNTV